MRFLIRFMVGFAQPGRDARPVPEDKNHSASGCCTVLLLRINDKNANSIEKFTDYEATWESRSHPVAHRSDCPHFLLISLWTASLTARFSECALQNCDDAQSVVVRSECGAANGAYKMTPGARRQPGAGGADHALPITPLTRFQRRCSAGRPSRHLPRGR